MAHWRCLLIGYLTNSLFFPKETNNHNRLAGYKCMLNLIITREEHFQMNMNYSSAYYAIVKANNLS